MKLSEKHSINQGFREIEWSQKEQIFYPCGSGKKYKQCHWEVSNINGLRKSKSEEK